MKKILYGIAGTVAALLIISNILLLKQVVSHEKKNQDLYVESVSMVMDSQVDSGRIQKFSGVVETQKQIEIQAETERSIKEIYVSEGDQVSIGTVLFVYDTSQEEEKLAKLQLELEGINSVNQNKNNEITNLEKEKKNASKDMQLDYTTQIQNAQIELKQNELERKSKEFEIANLQSAMDNSEVKSTIDGVVKQINKDNTSNSSFMTIISLGDYRIKGKINEQNIGELTDDQQVIVYSRIDSNKYWTGTVSEINVQNTSNNTNESTEENSDAKSSSYDFFVTLDNFEDLMLGQHVYIEANWGQQEKKEGIWLDETYIVMNDKKSYVWADNGKNEIEKKEVVLGQYDENLNKYAITKGLTLDDKIALPNPNIRKGMKVIDTSMGEKL